MQSVTKTKRQTTSKEPASEIKSTVALPYNVYPRRVLLTTTRHTHCFQVWHMTHGIVYIGEMGRSMHEQIKEHDRDISSHKLRPQLSQNMLMRLDTIYSGTRLP